MIDVAPDGTVTGVSPVPVEELRRAPAPDGQVTDVVQKNSTEATDEPDPQTGEVAPPASSPAKAAATTARQQPAAFDVDAFATQMAECKTQEALDAKFDELRSTSANDDDRAVLSDVYQRRANEIEAAGPVASPPPAPAATSRRTRAAGPSVE